ncbi:oligosaccharide flippase family protein [Streptomyces sp. NPDC057136]|uniref:oligosaccharide flippase family protein n=1 Tax=Streptomyces sp. NPDC057136 TaxID=3346029 RepID=UPI0036429035
MSTTARSLGWNYGGSALGILLQLGYTAVTARLVAPDAFGAYATAVSVAILLGYVANSGLATCVLRAEQLTRSLLYTVFALAAVFGVVCFCAALLAAPLLTAVWEGPHTAGMLRVLATQFLVQPAALAAVAALRRLERPGVAVRAELTGQTTGSILALALLLAGWDPYALAAALPLSAACTLVLAACSLVPEWRRSPTRARRWYRRRSHPAPAARTPMESGTLPVVSAPARLPVGHPVPARELLRSSGFFTAWGLVQSAANNAPLWLAGATFGAATAGHYSRAALLTGIPLTVLAQGLNRASTPALAAARSAGRIPQQAVHDVLCSASAMGLIGLGALAGLGPAMLLVLLGPAWETAAGLVPVLAAGGALAMLCSTGNSVDTVRRDIGALLRTQFACIGTTALLLGLAWAQGSLLLAALATVAAPLAGHLVQLTHWRTAKVLAVRPLLTAHAVHAGIGTALGLSAALGLHSQPPHTALLLGLGAMLPVVLLCAALRTRLPVYAAARRHGLGRSDPRSHPCTSASQAP